MKKLLIGIFIGFTMLTSPVFADGTYSINYNLSNGETNHSDNPATFIGTNLPITLQKPTRTDYAFMGWCADDPQSHSMVLCTMGNTVKQIKVCSDDATSFCSDQDVKIGNKTNGVTLYPTWVADEELYCNAGRRAYFAVIRETGALYDVHCHYCGSGGYCPNSKTYKLSEVTEEMHYNWSTSEYAVEYAAGKVMCPYGSYSHYGVYPTSIDNCESCPYGSHSSDNRAYCVCEGSDEMFYNDQCVSSSSCPAGMYMVYEGFTSDGTGWVSCNSCGEGNFCEGIDEITLADILTNGDCSNNVNGMTVCYYGRQQCPYGTYSNEAHSASCKSCINGTVYRYGSELASSGGSSGGTDCRCNAVTDILDDDNGICVPKNQISCPAGSYAFLYNKQRFKCYSCGPGYACSGGTYDISYVSDSIVGIEYCGDDPTDPEHAYTNSSFRSECSYCTDGKVANTDHTDCVCPDGTLWNTDTQSCQTPSCPAGQYVQNGGDSYSCSDCREGYYCDGSSENDGLKSCGENMYSLRGATDISDCKSCSSVANSTGVSDTNGCICNNGYRWNRTTGKCQYQCPRWNSYDGNFVTYKSDGGILMPVEWFDYDYTDLNGNMQTDCIMPWLVFDGNIETEDDMMTALENGTAGMMMCRVQDVLDENNNVVDHAYVGPCTKVARMCGGMEQLEVIFSGDADAWVEWLMQELHTNNYANMFTSTTNIDVSGTNENVAVFNTAYCSGNSCASPKIELSMLGAPMCLIPGLPQNNELGLVVRKNGNQYHLLLSATEQVIHSGSEHKVKIITQNGTYYVHDESVAE